MESRANLEEVNKLKGKQPYEESETDECDLLSELLNDTLTRKAKKRARSSLLATMTPLPVAKSEKNELCCWPLVGIVANVHNDNRSYWLNEFSQYSPVEIEILGDANGSGAQVVLVFGEDRTGFKNAIEFERLFQDRGCSWKEWNDRRTSPGASIYGWFGREDDYKSEGPVGDYLRKKGALKTISGLFQQPIEEHNKIVGSLINEIDLKNQNMDRMKISYNEKVTLLSRMLEEKDKLHETFFEETKMVQNIVKRALDEQEMLYFELENESKKLDSWSEELHGREALIELKRMKLEEEKTQNELRSNALEMATKNRMTFYENSLRLVEENQRDTEKAQARVQELERDHVEVQKMKTEIQKLKLECKLEEMKNSGGQCVVAQEKIDLYRKLLREKQEKEDGLNSIKELNTQLTAKERQTNDELQDTRKELIKVFIDMRTGHRVNIGVKEMNDNQSKGCLVSELWNFKEDRKATLIEATSYLLNRLKTLKRKRKMNDLRLFKN